MENIKLFYACNNIEELENRINKWLEEMGDMIEITRVLQDASGRLDHHITISIFYKAR